MFDIGWLELMVIGIVALIVVGPKDLPGMFRTVGNFVGKARGMAREFQRSMEAAADESGLKDVTDGVKEATSGMQDLADPLKQAQNSMKDYSKNFVTQKDQKTADAATETAGEKLVKEATAVASPAAKKTAAKVESKVSEVAPAKKTAPKKPATKKTTGTRAVTKTKAKPAAKKPATAKTKSE